MLLTRGQFSDKRRLGIDTLANICDHSVVGFAAHRSSKCEAIAALRGVRSGSPINRGRQRTKLPISFRSWLLRRSPWRDLSIWLRSQIEDSDEACETERTGTKGHTMI